MKVSDLITQLQECDPEAIVVLSSDPEGNSYSPVHALDDSQVYVPDGVRGELKFAEPDASLEKLGYGEEDCVEEGDRYNPCVVLWPQG